METTLDRVPCGARAAVIRLRSLGDCVLTTPALEILKRSRPDLKVGVVVEDRFAAIFEGNPDIDDILPPRLGALAKWKPALCLNLHGGPRSMALSIWSGARFRAGFGHHRHSLFYNVRIPPPQRILGISRKAHTVEHLAAAVFHLGAPLCEIPSTKLFANRASADLPPYAVLHPAASAHDKTWPAAGFLEVARHLREAWGVEPVFVGGAEDDLAAFSAYRTCAGAPLAALKTLIARASAFVGNDAGPAHMAAAFGVPAVVIFGNSDLELWRPWKAPAEAVAGAGPISEVSHRTVIAALERLKVTA
jgi:ADP-heptose:LPS heptosyltransferase